jgi:nucleotide-binding universal stress UspA family protein
MFKRILFPTDGSAAALAAADQLAELLRSNHDTRVTIAVVIAPTNPDASDIEPDIIVRQNAAMRRTGQRAVDSSAARLARAGVPHTTRILEGDPVSKAIVREAQAGYDLIAIGSRGMSMDEEDHHYIGSVAERVIRRSGLPVLVFPSRPTPPDTPVE